MFFCAQLFSFLCGRYPEVESLGESPFYKVKARAYVRHQRVGLECSQHWSRTWEVVALAERSGGCRTLAEGLLGVAVTTGALEWMHTALSGTCMAAAFLGKEPKVPLTWCWGDMTVATQRGHGRHRTWASALTRPLAPQTQEDTAPVL